MNWHLILFVWCTWWLLGLIYFVDMYRSEQRAATTKDVITILAMTAIFGPLTNFIALCVIKTILLLKNRV